MTDIHQFPTVRVETPDAVDWIPFATFGDARVAADNFARFGWKVTIHRMRRKPV